MQCSSGSLIYFPRHRLHYKVTKYSTAKTLQDLKFNYFKDNSKNGFTYNRLHCKLEFRPDLCMWRASRFHRYRFYFLSFHHLHSFYCSQSRRTMMNILKNVIGQDHLAGPLDCNNFYVRDHIRLQTKSL